MTSYQITAPEPFNFTHTEEWPRWIRRFERFRQASGLVEKSEENQVNTLIYSMGDNADDIFQAFKLSVEDMKKYDTVKGKFDNYFIKKKNIIYERAKFNSRRQEESEPVDVFITALYNLAEKCEYESLHDEMIRDRIVVGIADQVLSERMQLDENLTLEKAAKMARQSEAVKKQQPEIRGTTIKEDLDAIKTGKHKALKQRRPTPQSHASNPHHKAMPAIHPDDHQRTPKEKQLVQDVAKLLLMGETCALQRTPNATDVGKQDILKINAGAQ